MQFNTAMNNQPWTPSPSAAKGPRLYQGSQSDTSRTRVAAPKIRSVRLEGVQPLL